ncbi:unnamed protein product [Hymenolepis diminuta]|uniref:Mon2_C domain-containing protein n=1 Tax=Hymenolepis diminuta TaxID=6216 RepID=A0A0R3SL69_HYMDI|nr:unnamed protein product [Hymenolepis diminuta]
MYRQIELCDSLLLAYFNIYLLNLQKCARSGGSGGGGLLVHHSRDTAAKQWAETVVLTLSGVARCFVSKQSQLLALGEYFRCFIHKSIAPSIVIYESMKNRKMDQESLRGTMVKESDQFAITLTNFIRSTEPEDEYISTCVDIIGFRQVLPYRLVRLIANPTFYFSVATCQVSYVRDD